MRLTQHHDIPAEGLSLIDELTADLAGRYEDEDGSAGFKPADMTEAGAVFVIAWHDEEPVACGAIRPFGGDVCEVKRMYTRPHARKQGVARRVLAELERAAASFGYRTIRLETGRPQPEAISLYDTAGYHRIENYGVYAHDGRTVSFEKHLGGRVAD